MPAGTRQLPATDVLRELATPFSTPAHDRHVYCVFGPYARLRPFQRRLRQEIEKGSLNTLGRVEYLSLNRELLAHLKVRNFYEQAVRLANQRRDEQLRGILSATFRDLVTSHIEAAGTVGLTLADFELLYAYDLGGNDISLARRLLLTASGYASSCQA